MSDDKPIELIAVTSVNLTYLRHRAREGIPENPGSLENFLAEVDKACDELEDYRQREGVIYQWAQKQQSYDCDIDGLIEYLEGKADSLDTLV